MATPIRAIIGRHIGEAARLFLKGEGHMNWKEMEAKWPTFGAYARDHTAFEVVTSGGVFVVAVVAAAFLVGAVVGLTPWSWFFWAVAGVVALLVACTASIAWGKVK